MLTGPADRLLGGAGATHCGEVLPVADPAVNNPPSRVRRRWVR